MDIEKQREMMVYKAKEINEAVCRLSNDAYKLILLYISMIRPDDDPTQDKSIYLKDYCLITEENQYTIKDKIHEIVREIAENPLSFKKANGDFIVTSWFPEAEWKDDEKKLVLSSSKKLWPFLFDLKKKLDAIYNDKPQSIEMKDNLSGVYLAYPYGRIANIKGRYTIKFYEILKPAQKAGVLKIELTDLRVAVGAYKGTLEYNEKDGSFKKEPKFLYPSYANFKQSVLKPAKREIDEKMDITFSFTELKKGRKVIGLKFKIEENKNYQPSAHQGSLFSDDDACPPPGLAEPTPTSMSPQASDHQTEIPQEVINKIPANKYTGPNGCKTVLEGLLKKYEDRGQEAVEFYIAYILASKKDVPNWGGYITALEKNGVYTSQAEAYRQIKKEKATAEQQFLELYRTCEDQTLMDAYGAGNEYAIAVWNEGRGAEIEARRKQAKQNQDEEFAHKDQTIKELLDTDFYNFVKFANSKAFRTGSKKNFESWIQTYPETQEISRTAETTLRKAVDPYLKQTTTGKTTFENDPVFQDCLQIARQEIDKITTIPIAKLNVLTMLCKVMETARKVESISDKIFKGMFTAESLREIAIKTLEELPEENKTHGTAQKDIDLSVVSKQLQADEQ